MVSKIFAGPLSPLTGLGRVSVLAFGLTTALLSGCGSSSGGSGNTECTGGVPTYTQLSTGAMLKCTTCHSSTLTGDARMAATPGVDYNTYAAAKAHAEDGATQVEAGLMPFATAPKLTAQEKADFLKWANCGTPQ